MCLFDIWPICPCLGVKKMKAVIFFGHGARDARWKEPFDRLIKLWEAKYPNTIASLAFLEMMSPTLPECIGSLQEQGLLEIQIIPVFFGQGGHLRKDFPVILEECRRLYPKVQLSTSSAVGESDDVLLSIIEFTAQSIL
jgi:sirohydrochlorin cobaltochelatase